MIGLDDLDNRILSLLENRTAYSSEISTRLAILRTTIQYRLKRLSGAGLIKKNKDGQKSVWQLIHKNQRNKNYFKIYKGRDIIQAYRQFLSLPRETTVFCVQGNDAAKSQFKIFPEGFIKNAHRIYKRKKIILKGVVNEGVLAAADILNKDILKSHLGRTQAIKMFSGDKFTGFGEVYSAEEILMLANLKVKVVIMIKDKDITKAINDSFKVFFGLLENYKTFDLNQYIRNKIV